MMAASGFCADGGSCLATTVKMYDAASAGVRVSKTGPDWRPNDLTATRPRSAAALVSGCQPEAADVAVPVVLAVPAADLSTRAYQYQTPTAIATTSMRQPSRPKKPFIVLM